MGVVIPDDVLVEKGVQINNEVILSKHSYIGPYSNIRGPITVGEYFLCADRVSFIGGEHQIDIVGIPMRETKSKDLPTTRIGKDVWLGSGCKIMRGVSIGSHVVIAAGSVVTKDCHEGMVYGGVPAKPLRPRFNSDLELDKHRSTFL